MLKNKVGLEIGGPSPIFAFDNIFPVYPIASRIDNCNFSKMTVWEGAIREGFHFKYDPKHEPGYQYIMEAQDLGAIQSQKYDFVISSHTLEHTANPIKVLKEWVRVTKAGGIIVLVVPHKDGSFDHARQVTTLKHIISDYERDAEENDMTHLPEILKYHDLQKDPEAGNYEEFKSRSANNMMNRCLHHHVFDSMLSALLADHAGLKILSVEPFHPNHILLVAEKPIRGDKPDNGTFLKNDAEFIKRSPFPSDRKYQG